MANKVTQYKPQLKTENRAIRRLTAVGIVVAAIVAVVAAVADNAQKLKTITTSDKLNL